MKEDTFALKALEKNNKKLITKVEGEQNPDNH